MALVNLLTKKSVLARGFPVRGFASKLPGAVTADSEEVAELIARSRVAQAQIANYTQEQVDDLITACVWTCAKEENAKMIAQHTIDETRLGNYDGKYLKIFRKTRCALMDIIDDKSVGVIEEIPERGIIKIAKPVGVIGALSPSTNPEATPVIKSISAIKGRNSVIVTPHPRAVKTNKLIVDMMRDALVKMGAPADLIISIDKPTVSKTHELMRQCDRVLATGGGAMVNAAYSSGTPALGVGVGNAVVTVDSSALLDDAADKIVLSKTLDLAASCSADNSVLVMSSIYDEFVQKLLDRGGYILNDENKAKLQSVLWIDGAINAKIVAQPAQFIASEAGFDIPENTKFFIVPETGYGPNYPFSGEKMSVTMALYKVNDIDDAIDLTLNIQSYQGSGHSCGIYSQNDENIIKLANSAQTSRLLVNQPQAPSNSGNLWNGLRQTFSLGCGSWGNNSINHNITWKDLINETWVSYPLTQTKELIPDEELFARIKDKNI
jgi:sulfoacetaldehyde dehydrogenase